MELPVVVLLPSWPFPFLPQHFAALLVVTAQEWSRLTEIAVTPDPIPVTDAEIELLIVVPLPSWPSPFLPQHWAPPETSAHM
jgi:hypothetical protein